MTASGIAVFCGASDPAQPAVSEGAARLGRLIAASGRPLVYGGGKVGLMGTVADAALAAGGTVTGVIPHQLVAREVAHRGLTELVVVETMHERKARMYEAAAGFVILPGGFGTLDEAMEILTWRQLGLHEKPVVFWDHEGYYEGLLAWAARAQEAGLLKASNAAYLLSAPTIEGVWELISTGPSAGGKPMDWA